MRRSDTTTGVRFPHPGAKVCKDRAGLKGWKGLIYRGCRAQGNLCDTQNSPKESGITSEFRELEGGCLDYGYNPKVFIAVAVINCRGLAHVALQRPERKRWLELRGFPPSGDLNLWFWGWRVLGVPLEELCVLKSRNNSIRYLLQVVDRLFLVSTSV